jgi:hypothetical protein
MLSFRQLVDNNINSYNSYGEAQRKNMASGVLQHILDVDEQITKLYKSADAKKYPLRNNFSDASKTASSNKRIEAFQFVNSLATQINKGQFASEQRLLTEIRDGINRNDVDYTSGLIDATDNAISVKEGSKFNVDYSEIKKHYFVKIGIPDIRKDLQELKTRKAEFELILDAIEKGDEMIILPREFNEVFSDDDIYKHPKAREVSGKLIPHVNRSTEFLSKREATLK